MTATAIEEAPSDQWPEGALYYSPRGLYPFQAEDIARAYLGIQSGIPEWMFVWDTGLGKSHAAMRLATLGFEDDAVDFVLLVCERGKLQEWKSDFEEFTSLETRVHHGPRRKRLLHEPFLPQVLITTYETGKADLVEAKQSGRTRRKTLAHGDLLGKILRHSTRPMIIFDEADRLSNRSTMNYKAYDYALKTLRKQFKIPVLMLTATPIRKDWEDAFNQLRLLRPGSMPLVKEFGDYFVRARNMYGRALYRDHLMGEFAALCEPMVLAKSKTDPDVVAQFPKTTEQALWVDMGKEQRQLYDLVAELGPVDGAMTALRQICAYPGALVHSATEGVSKLARMLVEEYGADTLRAMGSAKTDALCDYLERVVKGQDAKAVVFTRWGPSVIPHLRAALTARGIPVRTWDEEEGIPSFRRATGGCVLLASDAVARGINLPEASYLVEYDMATTYGLRTQRINRASRIGSGGPSLTVRSMLCRESIEVPLMYSMLRGNTQTDTLLGRGVTGEEYLSADMRRYLLEDGMQ